MMPPTPSPVVYDPVTAHNSVVAFWIVVELMVGFIVGCLLVASLIDWFERRGWRPKNKKKS